MRISVLLFISAALFLLLSFSYAADTTTRTIDTGLIEITEEQTVKDIQEKYLVLNKTTTKQRCSQRFYNSTLWCGANQSIPEEWCDTERTICRNTTIEYQQEENNTVVETTYDYVYTYYYGDTEFGGEERTCWLCGAHIACVKDVGTVADQEIATECNKNSYPIVEKDQKDSYLVYDLLNGEVSESNGYTSS